VTSDTVTFANADVFPRNSGAKGSDPLPVGVQRTGTAIVKTSEAGTIDISYGDNPK
jgi:hypothetical protein